MSNRLVVCLIASGMTAKVTRGRAPQHMQAFASGARALAGGLLTERPLQDELAVWAEKVLEV